MSAVPAVECRQRLAVADRPGRGGGDLRRAIPDLLRRSHPTRLRDARPRARLAAERRHRTRPVPAACSPAVVGGVVALVRRPGPRSRMLLPAVLVGAFPIMALFENLIFAVRRPLRDHHLPVPGAGRGHRRRRTAAPSLTARRVRSGCRCRVGVDRRADRADRRATRRRHRRRPERATRQRSSIASTKQASTASTAATGRSIPVDFVGDRDMVGAVFPFWPIRFPERQRAVGATPPDEIAVLFLDDRRGSGANS